MAIDVSAVYKSTMKHFKLAQKNIQFEKRMFEHSADAISDVIPGFEADKLEFGSYDKENYAVLFVDMRRSTQRAQQVGPEKTFLTMHVFLTALLEVVRHYHGKVIDIIRQVGLFKSFLAFFILTSVALFQPKIYFGFGMSENFIDQQKDLIVFVFAFSFLK